MAKTARRTQLRLRRKKRIRGKISGTQERPRLSVFRSAKHVYAQVIDDEAGKTLVSVSSFEKGSHRNANAEVCAELGKTLAERCKAANVSKVAFDKNGYMYHGRIKALADGAREAGLEL